MVIMRIKVFLILFVLLVSVAGDVQAGLATDSATRRAEVMERVEAKRETVRERVEQKRAEIQQRMEERKEQMATRAAERRQRLAERKKALVRKFFSRMYRRFQAAVSRMERIADRIESRLGKMENRGIDVTTLRSDLAGARDDIGVAEGMLQGLEEKVEEALSSDDPKTAFEEVRDIVHETRAMLKEIHRKLVDIIVAMKGINTSVDADTGEATESGSPTATQSANTE
jgi:Skp family chaperone for outer membrane proteins